jgi:hypothetical protein
MARSSTVEILDFPQASVLDPAWVAAAYFRDSYRAPVSRSGTSLVDVFFALFGHHPPWMKSILILRNGLARLAGLDVPTVAEVLHPQARERYAVGDKIGVWPIYALSENELVAGRDNKHLDFRLSLLRMGSDANPCVVVSTVCSVHNTFGKAYLWLIVPFHKWGVRLLIERAANAGRL